MLVLRGSSDTTLTLLDTTTKQSSKLTGHEGPVRKAAFSPDGKRLASTGDDGTVRIWEVATGRELLSIPNRTSFCRGLAFVGPKGQRILVVDRGGALRTWDAGFKTAAKPESVASEDEGSPGVDPDRAEQVRRKAVFGEALAAHPKLAAIREQFRREGRSADDLESQVAYALSNAAACPTGHVIVGRVVVEPPDDPRDVKSQMWILDDGYFVGPIETVERPVAFRLHDYLPFELHLDESEDPIIDVGEVRMAPVPKEQQSQLCAKLDLDEETDLSGGSVSLSILRGPMNTPSGQYPPPPREAQPDVTPTIDPSGEFSAEGLSPAQYYLRVSIPGYASYTKTLAFQPGEVLNLGSISLRAASMGGMPGGMGRVGPDAAAGSKGTAAAVPAGGPFPGMVLDRALWFFRDGQRVQVVDAKSLHLRDAMTLEAWIKPQDDVKNRASSYIVSKSAEGSGFRLRMVGNRQPPELELTVGDTRIAAPYVDSMDAWAHVAAVCDGGSATLYVNAKPVAEAPLVTPLASNEATPRWASAGDPSPTGRTGAA
jgi:hypothetical protein